MEEKAKATRASIMVAILCEAKIFYLGLYLLFIFKQSTSRATGLGAKATNAVPAFILMMYLMYWIEQN